MATKVKRINTIGNVADAIQKVTYLKDIKANTVSGGTFTSGAYQTRDLNTQEGDLSFCSLSSNQFTLQPGVYHIDATAPVGSSADTQIGTHKAKLRNITNSTDVILGQNSNSQAQAGSANAMMGFSHVRGVVTVSSPTVFEIQHRCSVTRATIGFGFAASFGDSEVYTVVRITKIETLDEAY